MATRHKRNTTGLHPRSQEMKARAAFVVARSDAEARFRAMEIGALPVVDWRGVRLRTIRCSGTSGKGPHTVNVPPSLLWALIDVRYYRCPFHANDMISSEVPVEGSR
jgi:hypothetical protein